MIYFVKCFTEIYTAQVDCVTTFKKAVDYLTDSKNCMIAAHPLFKTKLFIVSGEKFIKFFNKAMFK